MGHHVAPDGAIYVDTAFINKSGRLPGMEIKHMGFGEFVLVTPKGEVDFDRMRGKDFPGQSGRSHKFYPEKLAGWVVEQMERKGLSEKMASTYSYDRTAAGNREVNQILRDMKKHLVKHKKRPDKRELETIKDLALGVRAHEKVNKNQIAEADKIEDEAKSIKVASYDRTASRTPDPSSTEVWLKQVQYGVVVVVTGPDDRIIQSVESDLKQTAEETGAVIDDDDYPSLRPPHNWGYTGFKAEEEEPHAQRDLVRTLTKEANRHSWVNEVRIVSGSWPKFA